MILTAIKIARKRFSFFPIFVKISAYVKLLKIFDMPHTHTHTHTW